MISNLPNKFFKSELEDLLTNNKKNSVKIITIDTQNKKKKNRIAFVVVGSLSEAKLCLEQTGKVRYETRLSTHPL